MYEVNLFWLCAHLIKIRTLKRDRRRIVLTALRTTGFHTLLDEPWSWLPPHICTAGKAARDLGPSPPRAHQRTCPLLTPAPRPGIRCVLGWHCSVLARRQFAWLVPLPPQICMQRHLLTEFSLGLRISNVNHYSPPWHWPSFNIQFAIWWQKEI